MLLSIYLFIHLFLHFRIRAWSLTEMFAVDANNTSLLVKSFYSDNEIILDD